MNCTKKSVKTKKKQKVLSHEELCVESAFEKLEIAQGKLDKIIAQYEEKLKELE